MPQLLFLLLFPLSIFAQTYRTDRYLEKGSRRDLVQSTWYAAPERPLLDVFYENYLPVIKTYFTYSDTTLVKKQQFVCKPGDSALIASTARTDPNRLRTDYYSPDGTLQRQLLLTLDSAGRTVISELYVLDPRRKRHRVYRYEFSYRGNYETRCFKTFSDSLREHDRSGIVPEIPPDLTNYSHDSLGRLQRVELVYFKKDLLWGAKPHIINTRNETKEIMYNARHEQRVQREVTDKYGGTARRNYKYWRNGKLKKARFRDSALQFKSRARFDKSGNKTREWEKTWGGGKRHYVFITTKVS